jgi:signal transduction histidine kinase
VSAELRPSVLVIDDEPDVLSSVKDLLRLDYRVLGATRAREAIGILEQEAVDVIMTDQRMPEMTGVELLEEVRASHPDATRLLLTGYADIRAVIDAINRGNVYRYVTKPWDPEELHAVVRDAVERHSLLAERQQLLRTLQERNEALAQANIELEMVSELKSNFIKVASHELRTPLTILTGLSYVSVRADGVGPPLEGWLRHMANATDRLRRRVDQLTTMLALERFDSPMRRQRVDVFALLRDAADDVQPFIDLRSQTLAREYPDGLGTIDVEVGKIRDCLNHLLLNAVKFTPDGGCITLAASRRDGAVEIAVTDTGSGIDAAAARRIFEPFFTGFDVSHHSSGIFEHGCQGLGLGLSVVKAFVEMHGGQVDVRSRPGEGSTFTILLPAGPFTG